MDDTYGRKPAREARKTPVPVGNDAVPIDNTKVAHRHPGLPHDYHNELSVPCSFLERAACAAEIDPKETFLYLTQCLYLKANKYP